MWFSKLKKKKVQYGILGIIFAIAIALISVSIIVTVMSDSFAREYYEGDSTPDIFEVTTNKSVVDKSLKWYESQGDEVRNYKKYDIFSVSTNLSLNGKINETLMSYVIPTDGIESLSNKVDIIEGDKEKKVPEEGTMWIPSTVANLKNIKVGDIAKIIDSTGKEIKFKISAIVNDSNQSSTAMGVLFVYVNELDREALKELPRANIVTMNCNGDTSEKSKELIKHINEPLEGMIVDKSLFIMAATMTAILIGGLGLIVAIIVTIVLMLILRSNIKNNILKEYKSIGIYKAMGCSSKKIRGIYLYGYVLVSIVSSIVGILISIPMVIYILNIAFKNLGKYTFDLTSLGIVIGAFIIFNLIVYINLYSSLRCINKIKPVDAIMIGTTSSKKKLKKSIIKNNSSSIAMAINDVFKYKKNNLIILIMFILVFYMSTLFINVVNSMMTLDNNLYEIFGTANADLVIAAPNDIEDSCKEINKYLDKDIRVEKYYLWNAVGKNKVGIDNSRYRIDSGSIVATTYDKFNEKDFSILQGLNPRNKNEASLSIDIVKKNNLKLGDYITLNIEGENKEYLIVGIFASMMNNGESVRLTNDVLSSGQDGNVAFVKLKNLGDYDSLKKDIDSKFKGISSENIYSPLKDTASQVIETAIPISVILLVGVLIFGLLNIINILINNNQDNRKKYGIMKSLGFTSRYIKQRNNYRIMSLAVVGAIVGVSLTAFTSRELIKALMGFDVFSFNLNMTATLVLVTFVLIIITMHICNKSIKKISTVELIRE